jgi:GntR family transcriptional regulator
VYGLNQLTGKIKLDFRSDEPLYLQISRQVEQLVVSGGLKQGDQLPTVRELAAELRINFNTVGRAYRILDESRLISTQRGRGTYIWEEPTEETMLNLREKSLEELAKNYLEQSQKLGYSPADAAGMLRKIIEMGGTSSPSEEELSA